MALTIGGLLLEARGILNDVLDVESTGTRYSDTDLVNAFNEGVLRARMVRPDLFLSTGLRNTIPQFAMPADTATTFPIDQAYYSPFLYYVVGRTEMREDTFADNSRAVTLMNKFVTQLLKVEA